MNIASFDFYKKKYIPSGSYSANLVTLTTGKIVSQVIPILLIPILTRLYSPGDFGVFAIFLAIIGVLSFLANARYNLAIMLPEKESDALRLFALSVFINLFFTCLLFIVVFFFASPILNLLSIESYYVVYLLPVSIFCQGFFESLYHLGLRKRLFKALSITLIFKLTLIVLLKIGFAFVVAGGLGLILGHILGFGIGIIVLTLMLIKEKVFLKFRVLVKKGELFYLAKLYKKFPIYSLPGDMLNEFSRQLPNFLLNSFFGSAIVGNFSLTQRVLGSPIALITGGLKDVFRERASYDYRNKGSCRDIFKKTFNKLLLLSILPFLLIFLLSPMLVPIIFGSEWSSAGDYIQIMTSMFFLRFLATPFSSILYIAGKQVYKLVWEIFSFLTIFVSFTVGYTYFNEKYALSLYSLSLSVLYVILLFLSYRFSKKHK